MRAWWPRRRKGIATVQARPACVEADSSSRPVVETWRSKQTREHDTLSHNNGRREWGRFLDLGDALWPSIKSWHKAEIELDAAKDTMAADEDGTAKLLEAANEEYALANVLYQSTNKYYLNVNS